MASEDSAAPPPADASDLYDAFVALVRARGVAASAVIEAALGAALGRVRAEDSDAGGGLAALDILKGWPDSFRPLPRTVVAELRHLHAVCLT